MRRLCVKAALSAGLAAASGLVGAALSNAPAAEPDRLTSYGWSGLWQTGVGLALVLALIFFCAWLLRRLGFQPRGGQRLLKVVSSVMVGQRERVVVVEVQGTWLVLGVTTAQVRTLHTLAAEPQAASTAAQAVSTTGPATNFSGSLRAALQQLRKPVS